jgi:hypothetical protein
MWNRRVPPEMASHKSAAVVKSPTGGACGTMVVLHRCYLSIHYCIKSFLHGVGGDSCWSHPDTEQRHSNSFASASHLHCANIGEHELCMSAWCDKTWIAENARIHNYT